MAHYLVDQFNKHQRKGSSSLKAKNEPPLDYVDRGVGNTEGRGALEDPKIGQPEKRDPDGARQPTPTSPRQTPNDSSNLPQSTNDTMRNMTKRRTDEDSKSTPEDGGRPNKHHQAHASYYDTVRDEQHAGTQNPVTEPPNRRTPSDVWPSAQAMTKARTGSTNPETQILGSTSPPSSPVFNTTTERDFTMLLQPETRPITQEQLVNEVKGIYAGLVMVEKKCVEIDQQQASTTTKLSNEQWQALTALHRTLLHEHHDFFLASQHPSSSPALRRLAIKYAMPARMWRHGIHSFLELLRHRLPDSLEQMLTFVYLAYSMMALLMESVPSFEETWIECLGDLARYRMAIEEADLRDREVWSGVARMWYNKAADKSPNVGRIQHHLAVLARPNVVQQLFYYSKALVSVVPFQNARESIMLLFNPFLEGSEIASQRYPLVESTLVKANGLLFTHGSIPEYMSLMAQFCSTLDNHIGRVTAKFRVQGPEIASSLCAATLDFGNAQAFLSQAFRDQEDWKKAQLEAYQLSHGGEEPPPEDSKAKYDAMQAYWASFYDTSDLVRAEPHSAKDFTTKDATFSGSHDAGAHACQSLGETTTVVSQRIGDKNILPYMHVVLAYLFGLAFVPNALVYIERFIPWENITIFLNTLGRSGVVESRFEGTDFPQQMSGTGRQLPEDFIMRGLVWAQHYFPADFFGGQVVDEDERNLELPSHAAPRAERCLWLGVQLSSLNRWISYDSEAKQFSVTNIGRSLNGSLNGLPNHTLDSRSQTVSAERDLDADMIDAE